MIGSSSYTIGISQDIFRESERPEAATNGMAVELPGHCRDPIATSLQRSVSNTISSKGAYPKFSADLKCHRDIAEVLLSWRARYNITLQGLRVNS